MNENEIKLLKWMHEFYWKCEDLKAIIGKRNYNSMPEIKDTYAKLKNEIKEFNKRLIKLENSKLFADKGFLNLCISNVSEAAAFGFTEKIGSNNVNSIYDSVETASYKISRDMSHYLPDFYKVR